MKSYLVKVLQQLPNAVGKLSSKVDLVVSQDKMKSMKAAQQRSDNGTVTTLQPEGKVIGYVDSLYILEQCGSTTCGHV